jgi:hypothetical protein
MVIVAGLALAGCTSSVVAPEGTTAEFRWVKGELKAVLPASLPRVEQAARTAFDDLNLVGVDSAVDGLKGEMSARMAVGTKVRVKLKAVDFESTTIRIRVGTIGDKSISLQLLRHIERQLQ